MERLILTILLFIVLTVGISGLLLTIAISRNIFKSIGTILKASEQMAKGNFTTKAVVYSQDEIGRLADSFNKMTEELERNITALQNELAERKKAEEQVKKLNRVYTVLSNINQTIVHERDKQTLNDEVCRIAVEDGKFKMAWIGMVDPQTHIVNPVASSGFSNGYLKNIDIDLNDEELSQGPTGRAVKSGTYYLANDIVSNPEMIPWRENALKHGYKSSAAFPIKVFGKTIGAIMLYSDERFFFDTSEVKLLNEMAMDISFAIEVNKNEIKRKLAEEEIRKLNETLEQKVTTEALTFSESL